MELNDLLLLLNYNDGFDGNALASAFLEIDANTFNYYAEYDPLQHNVHNTSLSNPITLDCSPVTAQEKNMLEGVQKLWDDNKLDYKSKFIAKILFSECECAEIKKVLQWRKRWKTIFAY